MKPPGARYPDDADGQALHGLEADGSDLSKPMDIDFAVACPDEASGLAVASEAAALGYGTEVGRDDGGAWCCSCTRHMVATYEAIIAAQAELDVVARRHGGHSDGWGTFGNAGLS